jgi:hypothetical protein
MNKHKKEMLRKYLVKEKEKLENNIHIIEVFFGIKILVYE